MWESIIGHRHIITMLQGMLTKGSLPHALILAGPAGVGKGLTAHALAAAILCGRTHPCGSCPNCTALARQSHAGLFRILPDGNVIKIDQIRALQHEAGLGAATGSRVCIMEDAEKMTLQAANSLLKLLEEPPDGFYFILLTSSPHALLGTVRSRCVTLKFLPLTADILAQALADNGHDEDHSMLAARLSGGRLGKALGLLEPNGLARRDEALQIICVVTQQQSNWFFPLVSRLDKRPAGEIQELLRYMTVMFRDIMILQTTGSQALLYNTDCLDELQHTARLWSHHAPPAAVRSVRAADRALAANANSRLTLEGLLIELADMAKEESRDANRRRNTL